MPLPPVVTVGHLLRSRGDLIGFGVELLAGAAGLHRAVTSPYIQKTGLAWPATTSTCSRGGC